MSDPTIPLLSLKNDHSAMGIKNDDTYGLHLEIATTDDWIYTPAGRFPDYDCQILISIRIGSDPDDLCASSPVADNILFTQYDRESIPSGSCDADVYSWDVTIAPENDGTIISKANALVIQMSKIKPNDAEGEATISFLPRLKARPSMGKTDINGTVMSYKVEKTTPPMVIKDVRWSLMDKSGPGTLTWTVTGDAQRCTIEANGEQIKLDHYERNDTTYKADMILQSGPQIVTITAWDPNDNTASNTTTMPFESFNPYFNLRISNGRPLSLVQSDQTAQLYAVFASDGSGAELWQNDQSGTQNNWKKKWAVLKGYETSPCVYYKSNFYLLGGSSFDFECFQNKFWKSSDGNWNTIAEPGGWKEPRIGQAVVLFNQSIWIAGGYGSSGKVYDDVYSYNQDQDQWTPRPTLPLPLCNAALAVVNGSLYLFGGFRDMPGSSASTKLYCLSGEYWVDQNKTPPPPATVADYWALGSLGDDLLLLGSFNGTSFTGKLKRDLLYWQSTTARLSDLLNFVSDDQSPFGFSTFAYQKRLFLIMTAAEGRSVFGYYDPSTAR